MATPIFANNPAAVEYLRRKYIESRWRSPFVTDTRISDRAAKAMAFAQMRARLGR